MSCYKRNRLRGNIETTKPILCDNLCDIQPCDEAGCHTVCLMAYVGRRYEEKRVPISTQDLALSHNIKKNYCKMVLRNTCG